MIRGLKLYMVDDDKLQGKLIELKLMQVFSGNYKQRSFINGEKCIEALSRDTDSDNAPDVLILDYMLPDMNGLQILKEIKQIKPDLPVVVYSAQKELSATVDLFKEGIYDYIIKGENSHLLLVEAIKRVYKRRIKNEIKSLIKKGTMFMAVFLLIVLTIGMLFGFPF